jgi:hypothetical protein
MGWKENTGDGRESGQGTSNGRMGGWPQPYESKASKDEMLKALPGNRL